MASFGGLQVAEKFKNLKNSLKAWNVEDFGNID